MTQPCTANSSMFAVHGCAAASRHTMGKTNKRIIIWCIVGIITLFSAGTLLQGCRKKKHRPSATAPVAGPADASVLNLGDALGSQAKVAELTLTVTRQQNGELIYSQTFSQPTFPLPVPLQWYYTPPNDCLFTIDVDGRLQLGRTMSKRATINACTFPGRTLTLTLEGAYEGFRIDAPLIQAPASAAAEQSIPVSCTLNVTAPDIQLFPIAMTLSEAGGNSLTSQFDTIGGGVSGSFPDPYPLTDFSTTRTLRCQLDDGRTALAESLTVNRIPPTPTPTPTSTPTPTPTPTPKPATSVAFRSKEFQPLTVNVAEMLTDALQDIRGSGIDAVFFHANNVFTIDFSKPVSFASLKTSGNREDVIVKALNSSNILVDMDVAFSEFNVFGEGIVKLVLVEINNGKIEELSFIPQL